MPLLKLPGSALRLLDRAAARIRFQTVSRVPGIKELDGEIARVDRDKENVVANQDFEKAAALRDQAEKLRTRREQVMRDWEAVAGPAPEGVEERVVREMAALLAGRGAG
jgi:ATP-dependent Clp protease ATP-binding subunit ClpC